jgi:hypothetical protein
MSNTTVGKTTAALALIAAVLILVFTDYGSQTRVYDCGMAEWHPDIPNKVKEECRKLRYEEWNKQQHIDKKNIRT